jgi:hypothetical protein
MRGCAGVQGGERKQSFPDSMLLLTCSPDLDITGSTGGNHHAACYASQIPALDMGYLLLVPRTGSCEASSASRLESSAWPLSRAAWKAGSQADSVSYHALPVRGSKSNGSPDERTISRQMRISSTFS